MHLAFFFLLLLLSLISFILIHVLTLCVNSLSFIADQYSIIWTSHYSFTQDITYFSFGVITNKTAIWTSMCKSLLGHMPLVLGKFLEVSS
jgi:hypothetical protein